MQHLNMNIRMMMRKRRSLQKQMMFLRKFSQPALEANKSSYTTPVCLCDKNPVEQTRNDYLKMYSVESSFFNDVLSNAVPRKFMDLSKAIHSNMMMIRKPVLDVIDMLQEPQVETPPKILLHGPDGSGKSLCLLHIIHYCLLKNMLVIHVPNAIRFVDSNRRTQAQQAVWKTSRIDLPQESIIWLNQFRTMNSKFLTEVKTTQQYKWGKRESTDIGRPLMEVLELGVGRNMYANDAVGVLLKEIQLNKELEVLYAVDAINGFFGTTSHKIDHARVDINSLSLVHQFTKLLRPEHSLAKGAYVVATSRSVQFLKPASTTTTNHQTLEQLFDQSSLSRLSEFTDVEVPYYNEEEFIAMMNFYSEKGWLAREMTDTLVDQIRFMTGRSPNLLQKILRTL